MKNKMRADWVDKKVHRPNGYETALKGKRFRVALAKKGEGNHEGVLQKENDQKNKTIPDEMVQVMSHDMRNSLLSVVATLKLLVRNHYGKLEKPVEDKLKEVLMKSIGLVGMTEEYLSFAFSQYDGGESRDGPLDLMDDIINPVLEEFSMDLSERQVCFVNRSEDGFLNKPVIGNKLCLKAVLRNLLRNAIQHGERHGTIELGFQHQDSLCKLDIFNSGSPIPEEHRDKLFKTLNSIHHPGDGKEGNNGLGFGLYFIKEILKRHRWNIEYEAKTNGSNFVLTIPLTPAYPARTVIPGSGVEENLSLLQGSSDGINNISNEKGGERDEQDHSGNYFSYDADLYH